MTRRSTSYEPKPKTVGAEAAEDARRHEHGVDWEWRSDDAAEATYGHISRATPTDTIYSAVGGNCALNCNLKNIGAAARASCTTLKSAVPRL